jgi:hypothetical protein
MPLAIRNQRHTNSTILKIRLAGIDIFAMRKSHMERFRLCYDTTR